MREKSHESNVAERHIQSLQIGDKQGERGERRRAKIVGAEKKKRGGGGTNERYLVEKIERNRGERKHFKVRSRINLLMYPYTPRAYTHTRTHTHTHTHH